MNNNWRVLQAKAVSREDLLAKLLKNRGITTRGQAKLYLQPSFADDITDPFKLTDMSKAAKRLAKAIKNDEQIAIYGDYDIDGITATAILYTFCKTYTKSVQYYIPNRFEEGYGLQKAALTALHKKGIQLVVTVDCGITAIDEIAHAKKLGLDMIVTDHHNLPTEPARSTGSAQTISSSAAIARVNPKQDPPEASFYDLCGAGVAYYLCRAVAALYPEYSIVPMEQQLLELVALGTVCDVVTLAGDNRLLVKEGIKAMRQSSWPGLQALAEVSQTDIAKVNVSDLGFRFGPRLNASGRLEHAKLSLELILSQDLETAKMLAMGLNDLNTERQAMTQLIFTEACALAEAEAAPILVFSSDDWSEGVVGIVASRVAERYHKPTILFGRNGEHYKGSARSYGGFNIIDAVTSCKDILVKYGGHSFAAGMSLAVENFPLLRQQLADYTTEKLAGVELVEPLEIDCELGDELLRLETLVYLSALEPFGRANPSPRFCSKLSVALVRPVGKDLSHLQLKFATEGGQISAIAFGKARDWDLHPGQEVEVAYQLERNVWNGQESLQLVVDDIR